MRVQRTIIGSMRFVIILLILALGLLLLARTRGRTVAQFQSTPSSNGDENWYLFFGSAPESTESDDDRGYSVTVGEAGYAYVVGQSINGNWGGTAILTHSLGLDGFLAKLDSDGALLWRTFIGGSESDSARAIITDDSGGLYVAGTSNGGTWSSRPISSAHGYDDVWVAKFNTVGTRQWFTFVGTSDQDYGEAIAVDGAGNIYVGGMSGVNPYLAKLNNAGEFQWQRAITSTQGDLGTVYGVAVDGNGDVYLTGSSRYGEWYGAPLPVRSHAGPGSYDDAFVAKFDGDDGALLWHTFLGAADWEDQGHAIGVDASQTPPAVYVAGHSSDDWGTAIQPFTHADAFVARLNGNDGTLVWNTFMGNGTYGDKIHAVTFDIEGNLYLAGTSREGWGRPVIPHPGGDVGDTAFVAALSPDGHFLGNTFVGGATSSDDGYGIALSDQGVIYVVGISWSPDSVGWSNPDWGTPLRDFRGDHDAFVAKLGTRSVVRHWLFLPLTIKQ